MPFGLRRIVADATPFSVRLGAPIRTERELTPRERATADRRLDRWRLRAAGGDEARFERRLRWVGLTRETASHLLGRAPAIDNDAELPEWAELLERVVRCGATTPPAENPGTVPFEPVVAPFVRVATARLHAAKASCHMAAGAWMTLERSLLTDLAGLAGPTLAGEFDQVRPAGHVLIDRLSGGTTPRTTTYYEAFVAQLLQDGGAALYSRFPVLARLLATRAAQWARNTTTLVERLDADYELLRTTFSPERDPGCVVAVSAALSDRHHQGQAVAAVQFESGLTVAYKPKDVGMERAFEQFVDHCNRLAERDAHMLPLRTPRVIDRRAYGWSEFVAAEPCADVDALRRFYVRAGELLAFVHLLGGTDCHFENLVAAGEHPVLIDMESLLHPYAVDDTPSADETTTGADAAFWESPIRTGLLPIWETDPDRGVVFDVSALGTRNPWAARDLATTVAMNTDAMRQEHTGAPPDTPLANLPHLDGAPAHALEHVDDVLTGYGAAYRFLLQHRAALLADNAFGAFGGARSRFVFRPTRIYNALGWTSLSPSYLRSGIDHGIELDALARAYLGSEDRPRTWALLDAESSALENGDIPHFTARADSNVLDGGVTTGAAVLDGAAFDRMLDRFRRLDGDDLLRQLRIIDGAICASGLHGDAAGRAVASVPNAQAPLTTDEARAEAARIAAAICDRAYVRNGEHSWIGFAADARSGCVRFEPLGPGLYQGTAGIALMLAAVGHVTRESRFVDAALGALLPVRGALGRTGPQPPEWATRLGIGAAHGIASIVYAMTRVGRLLGDRSLIADAAHAAGFITLDAIAAADRLDVMDGVAGAVLGLAALCEDDDHPRVLSVIRAAAARLASGRAEVAQPGFAHGAAGIAYALARAREVGAVTAPAAVSLARSSEDASLPFSWCRGAVGPALAAPIDPEVSPAARAVARAGLQPLDHICCGNFGAVELLAQEGRRVGDTQMEASARSLAAAAMRRAQTFGEYRFFGQLDRPVFNPTLFQGAAGVALTLARLAHPVGLPSVLLWH